MSPERPTRVLIVDDSAVMRSLLRAVVCGDGSMEVAGTAADGESALYAVESLRPDVVLLDVEMPVMDGLATLRELRARGHHGPVIMCSSLTQRGGARNDRSAGFRRFRLRGETCRTAGAGSGHSHTIPGCNPQD